MMPLHGNIPSNSGPPLQPPPPPLPSVSAQPSPSLSFKDLRRNYNSKKKCFTKTVQSAIESTQEVHSGWLKVRTTFKRWTKIWCQVKPGYLILYTSQEALKKHRLGVVLLSVCQMIKRPTRKEGVCFKLMNPFGCSVWAKSSTKALMFAQSSLTLRVSDESICKLWLDALNQCDLSSNLEGHHMIADGEINRPLSRSSRSEDFSIDDGDQSTRHIDAFVSQSNTTSENNSMASSTHIQHSNIAKIAKPLTNGEAQQNCTPNVGPKASSRFCFTQSNSYQQTSAFTGKSKSSSSDRLDNQLVDNTGLEDNSVYSFNNLQAGALDLNHNVGSVFNRECDDNIGSSSTKFNNYSWKDLQLEKVCYVEDKLEELGCAGVQTEDVHESNKNLLWHILKQLRPGMDLSKVTLPTFILEPRSFLEKLSDYYYHCDILSETVLIDDPVVRMVNIVKWYLSGFYKKPKGPKKPYNPILGERFRCFWYHPKTRSRTFFIAEQVSHHPPISAFHVSNRKDGYTITFALLSKSKFTGNSVSAILDGKAKLYLTALDETYTLTMPYANCRGILLGSLCLELGGKVEIECLKTGCKAELDFKLAPIWGNSDSYNSLSGKILKDNSVIYTLDGQWDKKIRLFNKQTDQRSTLWEVNETIRKSRLRRYTVDVEQQHERESVRLWKRVSEALRANDQTSATAEKTRLEDIQRKEARERIGVYKPTHFEFNTNSNEWTYRWQDDRVWDIRRDIMQFEDDFKIRTLVLSTSSVPSRNFDPLDLPITQLSKLTDKMNRNGVLRPFSDEERGVKISRDQLGPHELRENSFRTMETRITAGTMLFEEAIRQVNERNKKLEEDIALLKRARGKRTLALFITALIVATLSMYFHFF